MSLETNYFNVKARHLRGKKIFPFTIFIYNPNTNKYSPFLLANSPLIQAKVTIMNITLKNGGHLAVAMKDKPLFFKFTGLTEEQLKQDSAPDLPPTEANSSGSGTASPPEEQSFNFSEQLADAIKENDYQEIINHMKKEVDQFKPTISHTVSLARYLVNTLLTEDNYNNRIVAVSYCFAKILNMNTEDVLADLICAAFFHHIGITQLHGAWAHQGYLKMYGEERKKFMKHTKVSYHILKKVDLVLTDRCYKIILEHHERVDGSGYPQGKIGDQIEPLALILGLISHVFEYSTGRITGDPVQIPVIIKALRSKSYLAGLECQFGDTILETFIQLLETEDVQKKNKIDEKSATTNGSQSKDKKAA